MKVFLLDLIFPKYCVGCKKIGEYICAACFSKINFSQKSLCAMCQKASIDGLTHPCCQTPHAIDGIIAGVEYYSIVKRAVYQFKYEPYVKSLAPTLTNLLYEALIQNEAAINFLKLEPTATAVPLSKKGKKERGYNQAEILGKALSEKLNVEYENFLKRRKNTKPQFSLSKKERLTNVGGVFEADVKKKSAFPNSVILIDDVTTTGATLRECAKVLKRNGVKKVLGIAFTRE